MPNDCTFWDRFLQTLSQINQLAKALTRDDALGAEYYILIDDLDLHWRDSPLQNSFLAALLLSIRRFAGSPRIKFVVSLRNYIFERIDVPEKDKVRDSVVSVRWDSTEIRSMIESRLSHLHERIRPYIWSDVFPRRTFDVIREHTDGTPRECIRLAALILIEAKRNGHPFAYAEDTEAALVQFAGERLSDLASVRQADLRSIDRVARRLVKIGTEFSYNGLEELAIDLAAEVESKSTDGMAFSWAGGYYERPLDLAKVLLEAGLLQYKPSRTVKPQDFDNHVHMISEKSWYAVHPKYKRAIFGS